MNTKEVAEICGVSEQAIRAYYQRVNVTKIGGKWQPTDEELETLYRYYNVSQVAQEEQAEPQENERLLVLLEKQLETLQEQLKIKDRQIEEQQETIRSLLETNKALSAATALSTAADKKEALLLEPSKEPEQPIEQEQPQKKRGFWARLFG